MLIFSCLAFFAPLSQDYSNPCLGQANTKPRFLATNLKGFGIPFKINATDDSFIEVQLYVSYDRGRTWRFHDRQPTDKTEFPFRAENDGEYWFALKTLNRNRQLIPEGNPTAELVIVVDTDLPDLTFNIQADPAGRIGCRWKATDKNLKADTLQILYQPIGAAPDDWKKIPVNLNGTVRNGSYADQIHWWPDTTETSLNVRLSIADQAGNVVYQDRRINVPASPWRHRREATARTGDANSSGQVLNQVPKSNETEPPTQSAPIPFPLNNQTTKARHSNLKPAGNSGSSSMPNGPEYICENGVCRLRSASDSSTVPDASQPTQLPRTAANQTGGHVVPLVENKSTPNGTGRDLYAQLDEGSRSIGRNPPPASNRPSSGTAWESEPERWTVRNQTSSSTTRAPESDNVAPLQFPEQNQENPYLPDSNPNTKQEIGNQVVGGSSTKGPTNQYRLPEQSQPIAPPQFRTGNGMADDRQIRLNPGTAGSSSEQENWISEDRSAQEDPGQQRSVQGVSAQGRSIVDSPGPPISDQQTRPLYNQGGQGIGQQSSTNDQQPTAMSAGFARDEKGGASIVDESSNSLDASIQMISSKRFRLNYGIDAIDSSGVARVDLWMTRDNGSTWKTWGTDPDNMSPFPVEVDEEGRYGFRIVIHSKDGLTGRGPDRGDKPDLFVHVDSQAPLVQIMSVPYGRGDDVGRLVINYRVTDPWLTLRPISLYYSTTPEGPWTPIAEGLRNEGRYVWKPATNVPDRIFLRLDAIDRASNRGTHTLSQAIDVSGLVPRGTIHGVVPVGN